MNRKADRAQLAHDVFAESAPADFRQSLLGRTLRVARRRRRWRQAGRASVLAACVLLAGLIWRVEIGRPPFSSQMPLAIQHKGYSVVRTQPLPATALVRTHPAESVRWVASSRSVASVRTRPGDFRVIDDEQLLALLGSRAAMLVRVGPHAQTLVFANPEDAKGFPLN